jgi:hypothetical protein
MLNNTKNNQGKPVFKITKTKALIRLPKLHNFEVVIFSLRTMGKIFTLIMMAFSLGMQEQCPFINNIRARNDTAFVATSGHLYTTFDGGKSWSKMLTGKSEFNGSDEQLNSKLHSSINIITGFRLFQLSNII